MSDDTHPSGDTGVSGWFQRLVQGRAGDVKTRDDIAEFLETFHERGIVGDDEFAMLQGVLEVADTQVRDIMVPRSQMVVVAKDQTPEEVLKIITESNHSRFPVIGDDRDEVVGIVLAKDVLKHFVEDASRESFDIEPLLRPAVFIPESKRLNTLLAEFREGRNHMAIVVDEYGGVAGLLTIEDVLEQIVGDIGDEYDIDEGEGIRKEADRTWTVPALTRIEEFNSTFGTRFSDEECDTIGGLVLHELGRMPRRGEAVQIGGVELKVTRADRRRIETLRVVTPPSSSPA